MLKKIIGLGILGVLTAGCPGEQTLGCPVQISGSWAVNYTLVEGQPGCDDLSAELYTLRRYNDLRDTEKPHSLAIRPQGLYTETTTAGRPVGELAFEATDGRCAVSDATGTNSTTGVTYEFTNFEFLVTPTAPGSMFGARVTYSEPGCTATYDAVGVWPAFLCETSEDCNFEHNPSINPSYALTCERLDVKPDVEPAPGRLACMPSGAFPSLTAE